MMKPPGQSKSTTPDFQMKKEFIEKQLALKKYVDDVERLALTDIIRDPLVVHTLEDYAEMYREQDNLRRIRRTIKSLYRIKRRNVDILPLLRSLEVPNTAEPAGEDVRSIRAGAFDMKKQSMFRPISVREPLVYSKELALASFKKHLKRIGTIKKLSIAQPVFTRTLTASASHNQLIKKMGKQDSPLPKEFAPRPANEITSATSFRNGVLKPASGPAREAEAPRPQNTTEVRIRQILHPESFNIQSETHSSRQGASAAQRKRKPTSEGSAEDSKP